MKTTFLPLTTIVTVCIIHLASCNHIPAEVTAALDQAGSNRAALEKVIAYYKNNKNPLKLKAAYFLIRNMQEHVHYDAPFLKEYNTIYAFADSIYSYGGSSQEIISRHDSMVGIYQNRAIVERLDIESISSHLLISNIELAFAAWEKPWANHLSFEEFCEYILPYKVAQEKPSNWREELVQQPVELTTVLHNTYSTKAACRAVNNHLKAWFHINLSFNTLAEQSIDNLLTGKAGNCYDATNLALYFMRAQGIPVAVEFTPHWANKNGRHWWNVVLYPDGQWVNFLGAESNPGLSKMEHGEKVRAKIYRRTYAMQAGSLASINKGKEIIPDFLNDSHFIDVTAQRLSVSDVKVSFPELPFKTGYAYLCVFDNRNWNAIHWGKIDGNEVTFTAMGRHVAYLPAIYRNGTYVPIAPPFILTKEGKTHILAPDTTRTSRVTLTRKYPSDDTNMVKVGDSYELFYWNDGWQSLGVQSAKEEFLTYDHVPHNALLLLHNLDRGKQERIFTLTNQTQIWW